METIETSDASLRGQAEIWQHMFSFADSMALKCAVELRIADIINSHGGSITLSQIASSIGSSSPNISYLSRVMRLLVRRKIFAANHDSRGGETLYGLTHSSRWLLRDSELSLAPMILMENHPWLMAPWHCFSQCVKEGGIAFKVAHGKEIWDFALQNPEFNKLFNDGGGIGEMLSEIVKSYPHIKGINFDLPHVIATAPKYDGISHVEGDMFKAAPQADAVIMKWILHDWSDEDCVKILRNCKEAIPEKTGKVIIVDVVLRPDGSGIFDETGLVFDLLMLAHTTGGRERTEQEWKKLLEEGGFPRYNIINIPAFPFIIEAFPQ
ncbi:hypothetical protein Patl1_02213 [Pistacia atlantica]|uniref:Uncharacterized protein n=1 Tax=Pistacia atlantica TaxID=434234 RepID=A0ACC1CAB9_9ROSI|nr:hypothetical protein Patl1_02213 [Pistacia atlantica]